MSSVVLEKPQRSRIVRSKLAGAACSCLASFGPYCVDMKVLAP